MTTQWTVEAINQLSRNYQASCILAAAAELDIFTTFAGREFTSIEATKTLQADERGMTMLLDALAALALLDKRDDLYRVPPSVATILGNNQPGNQLAMAQHQATCLRRWAQLATVVKSGHPAPRIASIRGETADYASFIEAMDNIAGPVANQIVQELDSISFTHVLDVGGASGTWTIAFLKRHSNAKATLFDLPQVMPQARERIEQAGLASRVTFTPGDFYRDALPAGADLAWVSAIVHQNSREQNRALFQNVFKALVPGGQILIRDIVMESSRTNPVAGALFAINMLVATERGATFTFDELREDLASAGFADAQIIRRDEGMHSIVAGRKPS